MNWTKTVVEIKEYYFEDETYFKLIEKGFILGIRIYKDEHPRKFYTLAGAMHSANKMYNRLQRENLVGLISSKKVWSTDD